MRAVSSVDDLRRVLSRIDGRNYKAYQEIRGEFDAGDCAIFVDRVQGDPFATPSRLRLRVPQHRALHSESLFDNPENACRVTWPPFPRI